MARTARTTDISSIPQLATLVREVVESNEPRLLRQGDEDLALIVPLTPRARRRHRSEEDADAAFRSAAGGWAGLVDADELKEQLAAARSSDRPGVTL